MKQLILAALGALILASPAQAYDFCRGNGNYQDRLNCISHGINYDGYPTYTNNCSETVLLYFCYRDSGDHNCNSSGGDPTQFTGIAGGGTYIMYNGRATTYWSFVCR